MDSELPAQFSPWKSEHYFYEQYLAVPRASVYIAFGRISHIFIVTVDSDFPAQFALENLDIIFTCSHMAVGVFGGSDAFFALLRVVPELSASFSEPLMVKSSLPSRAPMPIGTAFVIIHIRLTSARVRNNNNDDDDDNNNSLDPKLPSRLCVSFLVKNLAGVDGFRCSRLWQLRSKAERGALAPLVAATRADDRAHGVGRSPAPLFVPRCRARDVRRFTKPEDGQLQGGFGVLRFVRRGHRRGSA